MDSNHFSFTNLVKIDFENYQFYISVSKSLFVPAILTSKLSLFLQQITEFGSF